MHQQTGAIVRPMLAALVFLDDPAADEPVGRRHHGVDPACSSSAGLVDDADDVAQELVVPSCAQLVTHENILQIALPCGLLTDT